MGTGLVAFQSPRRKEAPSGTGACLFLTEAEDRRVSLALVFITSFPWGGSQWSGWDSFIWPMALDHLTLFEGPRAWPWPKMWALLPDTMGLN